MAFSYSRKVNFPVGWIVDIEHTPKGNYGGFTYNKELTESLPLKKLKEKHEIESLSNEKFLELEQLRKRKTKIAEKLDHMTLREIKAWARKSPQNRKAIRFYLLEVL